MSGRSSLPPPRVHKTAPLLGPAFNTTTGPFPVPVSPRGLAAREEVLALVKNGQYETEEVPCLCGSWREELVCTVDRYYIPHRTVLCLECGLVRTNPRWTEKTYIDFYTRHYRPLYERPGHTAQSMFAVQRANAERRAGFVREHAGRERKLCVLEIGCGGGWNLFPFHQRGDAVVGYDFDEDYLSAGRALGLDLRNGGLEVALAEGQQYQLVILSHVVEHFLDPAADLAKVRRLLAPDGLLLVEVPNLFMVTRNLLRYWQSAHTYSFVPGTLRQLMQRAGYAEVALNSAIASIWRVNLTASAPVAVDAGLAAQTRRFLKSRESDAPFPLLRRRLAVRLARWWRWSTGQPTT